MVINLAKAVQDQCVENYKTSSSKIKEILNKWIHTSLEDSVLLRWQFFPNWSINLMHSGSGKALELSYECFNIPTCIFVENDKLFLKWPKGLVHC